MGLKSHLTPLSRIAMLDPTTRAKLESVGVTTVEELAGMLQADIGSVADLIGWPAEATIELQRAANGELDLGLRRQFRKRPRQYPLGALDPRQRDRR